MADRPLHSVLHFVRRMVAGAPGGTGEADANLLDRFVQSRDEAAFESLVCRHGPMVFGVCRRIVGDSHRAEDCFQAVFLVLAHKASSLRQPERLANWLYGVARRTAFKAASKTDLRPQISTNGQSPAADPLNGIVQRELRSVLDEELGRLPDRYRAPLVLCYLEGRTTQEAAHALGCPQGTVMTRLARGRERLRGRLSRRGVTLTTALLTTEALTAAVPSALLESTVRIAVLASARGIAAAATAAEVAALAQGVIKTMFWSKVTIATAILATVGGVGSAAGWFAVSRQGNEPKPATPVAEVAAVTQAEPPSEALEKFTLPRFDDQKVKQLTRDLGYNDKIKGLLEARHAAAAVEANARRLEFVNGRGTLEFLFGAARRLFEAELALCEKGPDRTAARENHIRLLKLIFEVNRERYNAGRIPIQDLKAAEYYLLDAEFALEYSKANAGVRSP